jgi:FKBP-type peptidyl-prolyl cis-trans isomerase 2
LGANNTSIYAGGPLRINEGTVVTLSYQLYVVEEAPTSGDDAGSTQLALLEERTPENPLEFVFGSGQVLPAVEKTLSGQTAGYSKVIRLETDEAFGEAVPELEMWVPLEQLPKKIQPQVGMKFQTQGPSGDVIAVLLKEIKDGKALLDGNHPLAGAAVQFDLRVLRVREASPEETASGEVQKLYH